MSECWKKIGVVFCFDEGYCAVKGGGRGRDERNVGSRCSPGEFLFSSTGGSDDYEMVGTGRCRSFS